VAELSTERRWKTFADVVAFALGTNVWISIVILPAVFVGALHGTKLIAASTLPFVVLLFGLARRSEAILLGLFPAAISCPSRSSRSWRRHTSTGRFASRWSRSA